MDRRKAVRDSLAGSVARLDAVLNAWGFTFSFDAVNPSHVGPYASGHFCRGSTKIGLSCRDTIDNLYYQHTFITQNPCSRETECYTIGHGTLMDALGHSDDCWLITSDGIPDAIVARGGGDRVEALLHDLSSIAQVVLREPCDEFYAIIRRGYRAYSID